VTALPWHSRNCRLLLEATDPESRDTEEGHSSSVTVCLLERKPLASLLWSSLRILWNHRKKPSSPVHPWWTGYVFKVFFLEVLGFELRTSTMSHFTIHFL
jgi:hypothetical protein